MTPCVDYFHKFAQPAIAVMWPLFVAVLSRQCTTHKVLKSYVVGSDDRRLKMTPRTSVDNRCNRSDSGTV